jgi:hypothetical protein
MRSSLISRPPVDNSGKTGGKMIPVSGILRQFCQVSDQTVHLLRYYVFKKSPLSIVYGNLAKLTQLSISR